MRVLEALTSQSRHQVSGTLRYEALLICVALLSHGLSARDFGHNAKAELLRQVRLESGNRAEALMLGRGASGPSSRRSQTTLLGLSVPPPCSLRTLKPAITSMIPNATA